MKKIMLGILALTILVSFVACDFFTTSWGSGLQRDLGSLLEKESPDDLAKLASDQNYKGDSKAAAALLNALSSKPEKEIQSFSSEEKNDILNLALTAALPIDAITSIIENFDSVDEADILDILDILSGSITEFDTEVIRHILNKPEGVSSESLIGASVALFAQVVKREGSDLDLEDLFYKEGDDGNLELTSEFDPRSQEDIEAIFNILELFGKNGDRKDESPSFLDFSLEDLFGGRNENS